VSAGFIIVILAIGVVMYFILIRPQRAQQRKQRELIASVGPGDEVVTIGGLYADVVEVDDEGEKLVVEIAEDVHIEIARRAVASVVKADDLVDLDDADYSSDDEGVHKYDPGNVRSYTGVGEQGGGGPTVRVLDQDASSTDSKKRSR